MPNVIDVVALSVCWTQLCTLQKQLNWLRCLACGLRWAQGIVYRGADPSRESGNFGMRKGLTIVKYRDRLVWAVQIWPTHLRWLLVYGLMGTQWTQMRAWIPHGRGMFGDFWPFEKHWDSLLLSTQQKIKVKGQLVQRYEWILMDRCRQLH